jgi:MATE family multidrug resistance protein
MSFVEQADRSPATAAAAPPAALGRELRELLTIATPVVLAEIGWMSMSIVDALMVGPLGPQAIGAVGLGSVLFLFIAIIGMGMTLGLDTLISQAYGARRTDDCHRWLFHGAGLAVLLSLPLMTITWGVTQAIGQFNLNPEVAPLAASYIARLNYGLLPLLLYSVCRRYLIATGFAAAVTFALVTANLVNAGVNWVLIYGHFGLPALGTDGSAWATTLSRVYMTSVLIAAIVLRERRKPNGLWQVSRRLDAARMRQLVGLGAPAASQLLMEFGVFAAASAFAAKLSPTALAAHHIGINIIGFAYMVPLGISSAGAVMVGRAIGRRDPNGARRAGWLALALGAGSMLVVSLAMLVVPSSLIGLFTRDSAVIEIGVALMGIAAVFQLFDGVQVVATGVLRGTGDTRTPMITNFVGHWLVGLPVGWYLCFAGGWNVSGLWIGLSLGLTLVGVVLVAVWSRAAGRLTPAVPR